MERKYRYTLEPTIFRPSFCTIETFLLDNTVNALGKPQGLNLTRSILAHGAPKGPENNPPIENVIFFGVSGSGKTALAKELMRELGILSREKVYTYMADLFHGVRLNCEAEPNFGSIEVWLNSKEKKARMAAMLTEEILNPCDPNYYAPEGMRNIRFHEIPDIAGITEIVLENLAKVPGTFMLTVAQDPRVRNRAVSSRDLPYFLGDKAMRLYNIDGSFREKRSTLKPDELRLTEEYISERIEDILLKTMNTQFVFEGPDGKGLNYTQEEFGLLPTKAQRELLLRRGRAIYIALTSIHPGWAIRQRSEEVHELMAKLYLPSELEEVVLISDNQVMREKYREYLAKNQEPVKPLPLPYHPYFLEKDPLKVFEYIDDFDKLQIRLEERVKAGKWPYKALDEATVIEYEDNLTYSEMQFRRVIAAGLPESCGSILINPFNPGKVAQRIYLDNSAKRAMYKHQSP